MKMVRCCLRMQKLRRDDKGTFSNSLMGKCWKIPIVGTESVVRGDLIHEWVVISPRTRLKRP